MYVFFALLLPRRVMRYVYRWTRPCCLVCGYRNHDCACQQLDRMTTDFSMASGASRSAPPSLNRGWHLGQVYREQGDLPVRDRC